MKKVVLLRPPEKFLPHRLYSMMYFPLGLLSIAAGLEKAGVKVKLIDGIMPDGDPKDAHGRENFFGITFDEIKMRLSAHDFDCVGISAQYSFQWENALKSARLVKEINPDAVVIVGGAHVSVVFEEILKLYDCFDIVVRGEGEAVFPEIIKRLRAHESLEGINGIAYRSAHGILASAGAARVDNLDSLPFPAYHLLDMERYFTFMRLYASRTAFEFPGWERGISVVTSRGCPYDCVFCSIHLHMGKKWRSHSSEYILRHIDFLVEKYQVRYLHFEDDNLTLDGARITRILEGIVARARLRWDTPNGVRADTFDEGLLALCRQSGCTSLVFGIESGVQRVLDQCIDKRLDLKQVESVLGKAREAKVDTKAFFMLGLPGESQEDIISSIRYAIMLIRRYECFGGFSMAVPLKGTRLFEECKKNGYFTVEPTVENLSRAYLKEGIIQTEEFTPQFLAKMIEYFNSKINGLLFYIFLRKIFSDGRLLWYVLLQLLRIPFSGWGRLYNKVIFFEHSLMFGRK